MRRMIDELGNKYSRLYVIALADERINGQAAWICECQCGGSRVVRGNLLRKGITAVVAGLSASVSPSRRLWRPRLDGGTHELAPAPRNARDRAAARIESR